MRLRLAHSLALTLLAFTAVAVLALGGLNAWHLRHGFGEYLAVRDVQHFERFVGVVEAHAAREGGLSDMMAGRLELRTLLDELHPGPRRPPGPREEVLPPTGRNPDAFPNRIQVLASNGAVLIGPEVIDGVDAGSWVERPVHVDGQMVARARMRPAPAVRTGNEARFLQDQYVLIAIGGVSLLVLSLLTATWLARRWTRPLAAVQEATQRLAQGELSVRLPVSAALTGRGDEIGDVVRNVNLMAESLQKLEATRRRWLADISHELRTPLTVLRGDIEALYDGIRPLRLKYIAVLHEEVLRLNRVVDDLHLLAISDLQTLPCQMADDDAVAWLKRLQWRYEDRARAAGLRLYLDVPDDLKTLTVQWDAGRIDQLMSNLLENSLRYTQAPGVIRLGMTRSESGVRLMVEDSAPGVPDEQLYQVFEPLYRTDAASRLGSSGSGLGLAICQVIAKAHGGRLFACASALGGLRLTLELPQARQSQSELTRRVE